MYPTVSAAPYSLIELVRPKAQIANYSFQPHQSHCLGGSRLGHGAGGVTWTIECFQWERAAHQTRRRGGVK